jgi:hypothetical protein
MSVTRKACSCGCKILENVVRHKGRIPIGAETNSLSRKYGSIIRALQERIPAAVVCLPYSKGPMEEGYIACAHIGWPMFAISTNELIGSGFRGRQRINVFV